MTDVRGVECLAVGTWRGDTYTRADLDEIVEAFDEGFAATVKESHFATRPCGAVANLERVGDKLVADFIGLPPRVHSLIRSGHFDAVSSEILHYDDGDGFRGKLLSAVALVGPDERPAVAGLEPLSYAVRRMSAASQITRSYSMEPFARAECVKTYTLAVDRNGEIIGETADDPGAELVHRANAYRRAHPETKLSLSDALGIVRHDPANADLAHSYAEVARGPAMRTLNVRGDDPAAKLHALALRKIEAGACKGYGQAVREVLAENRELAGAYAGWTGNSR